MGHRDSKEGMDRHDGSMGARGILAFAEEAFFSWQSGYEEERSCKMGSKGEEVGKRRGKLHLF